MINLKIATNTGRTNAIVNTTDTLRDVLNSKDIDTTGANIMLNGTVVSPFDLDRTLAQCSVEDNTEAVLSVVVKASAAR